MYVNVAVLKHRLAVRVANAAGRPQWLPSSIFGRQVQ
jgi:hypothetical protein